MSIHENVLTVSKYNFIGLSEATIVGNLTTVFCESHRIPDKWKFLIRDKGLFDIDRNGYVHDIVKEYPHPNLYLRELEDNIIEAMDTWAISDQEGYLVWISPSFVGQYPCHKIEIIFKNPNTKETSNMVILFDGNQDTCLNVTKQIFPELNEIDSVEALRNSILIKPDLDVDKIIKIVGPYIHPEKIEAENPEEEIRRIAKLAINGVDQTIIAYEMNRVGVIGSRSFSCPGGLPNVLSQRSNTLEAKYVKNCGKCGKVIEKYICKGYECECGGVYEGC